MKNGRFICKFVLFTAVLALLIGLAAIASAEDCTPSQHVGPIVEFNRVAATCTVNGSVQKKCTNCGAILATEPIIAQGHHIGQVSSVITPATCTTKGVRQIINKCSVCPYIESTTTEDIQALDHDYPDTWTITKQPTCEGTGTKQRICRRDSSHVDTQTIEPLNHDWGGNVTTPSTCTTQGTVKQYCRRDSSHVNIVSTLDLDPNNHNYGAFVLTTKPTCTTPGQETSTCSYNSAHKQYRDVAIVPDAHVWDNGTYIIQPTTTSSGEIKYVCELNSSHTKTVKVGPLARGGNNTICAFGPRLRDTNLYPYSSDEWYMFTPFDASKDGVQSFELIAANKYIVGNVTLTIQEGNLKVDYTLKDPGNFQINLEFFTVLNRINDLTDYEPENLMHLAMNKGQFINLQERFGDDTNLVLYFCSRCNFTYSNKISEMNYESTTHQRLLQNMLALMD